MICNGDWLIIVLFCDGFFDRASVFTKSVAEMTFSLAYILKVAFITLYHIDEIGGRAGDVMPYVSLFVGGEKSARCGSFCNRWTRLAPSSVKAESSRSRGGGGGWWGWGACLRCLALTSMSRTFLQRR